MSDSLNRLDILLTEKRKLRAKKIRLNEIHHQSQDYLQRMLNISKIRAMELQALSEFQSIASIGIRFAQDLISLGFYSLRDITGKDPAKLDGVWCFRGTRLPVAFFDLLPCEKFP